MNGNIKREESVNYYKQWAKIIGVSVSFLIIALSVSLWLIDARINEYKIEAMRMFATKDDINSASKKIDQVLSKIEDLQKEVAALSAKK